MNLYVRILNELWARFAKVRILKELTTVGVDSLKLKGKREKPLNAPSCLAGERVASDERRGKKEEQLNAETQSAQRVPGGSGVQGAGSGRVPK